MSLLSQNQKGKKGSKAASKTAAPGAKQVVKPGKAASFNKKPVKTGGTRGS